MHIYVYIHIYRDTQTHRYIYTYIRRRFRIENSTTTSKAGWVGHLSQDCHNAKTHLYTAQYVLIWFSAWMGRVADRGRALFVANSEMVGYPHRRHPLRPSASKVVIAPSKDTHIYIYIIMYIHIYVTYIHICVCIYICICICSF